MFALVGGYFHCSRIGMQLCSTKELTLLADAGFCSCRPVWAADGGSLRPHPSIVVHNASNAAILEQIELIVAQAVGHSTSMLLAASTLYAVGTSQTKSCGLLCRLKSRGVTDPCRMLTETRHLHQGQASLRKLLMRALHLWKLSARNREARPLLPLNFGDGPFWTKLCNKCKQSVSTHHSGAATCRFSMLCNR